MIAAAYFKQLVRYNLWANKRIAEILEITATADLDKEIVSSFSSIRKTVYHIWDAEFIWLNRLNDLSISSFPSKEFDNTVPITKFLECSEAWVKTVESQDELFFTKVCSYKNLAQKDFSNTFTEIIMHCMNHSTYHRGQLVTMLRQVGNVDLPSTDLIAFFRE